MSGAYSYDGLTRVLHERARLSILTALSSAEASRAFADLKDLCELTDGNLNRHLKVLAEAGLVRVTKRGKGRGAETLVVMSAAGRRAFTAYLEELERVLRDARGASAPRGSRGRGEEGDGARPSLA